MPDPVIAPALIEGGSELLETLLGRLFGRGDRRRLRRFIERLEGQVGRPGFTGGEQQQLRSQMFRSVLPSLRGEAETIARRTNLDTGVARGAILDKLFPIQQGIERDITFRSKAIQEARDRQLRGLQFQGLSQLAS